MQAYIHTYFFEGLVTPLTLFVCLFLLFFNLNTLNPTILLVNLNDQKKNVLIKQKILRYLC